MEQRPFGSTGLSVTPICEGTSALGSFPAQYGYEVSETQALTTLLRVFEGPLNFIDTSNNYFEAEKRIGIALREIGGLPTGFVLATKVDPERGSTDLSGLRARASVQESLDRLGLDHLQLVYIHDPEQLDFDAATAPGGVVEAMIQMQKEALIDNIGVAGGPTDLMRRYVELGVFQAVISHNRFTLVDQSARPLAEEAAKRSMAFVNAAPYGGGMLVNGPDAHPNYAYRPAGEDTKNRVREMQKACQEYEIPLAAAALQFSMREPAIASTILGMSTPERLEQTFSLVQTPIPNDLWTVLDSLADSGQDG